MWKDKLRKPETWQDYNIQLIIGKLYTDFYASLKYYNNDKCKKGMHAFIWF